MAATDHIAQLISKAYTSDKPPHPLDPLDVTELSYATSLTCAAHGQLRFNTITLHEPAKAEFLEWLASPASLPDRKAEVVAIGHEGRGVYDGVVNLTKGVIETWKLLEGVQPIITMEDLVETEKVVRENKRVIEQCILSGIPEEEMDKVFCDPWTIGHDERFGNKVRLQQAFMYYRPDLDSNQYAHPLDFIPIVDTENKEVIHIDIPPARRPLNKLPSGYHPDSIPNGYRTSLKPIHITQPEGVSFTLDGHSIDWQNWSFHIGFNHREGLVLSNITYLDKEAGEPGAAPERRPIFYRMSLAEMVVPYGNPDHPHHRKHAFDLGEYGAGYMTNSLTLGCDCKGSIFYLPFHHTTSTGAPTTIENAVCIHEEDTGILFKHTDFRDDSLVVTRGRKLVVSQVFTAANYEYAIYWSFHLDGTIQLEIRLTGILNTYAMDQSEPTNGWGTQVHPGVNAHNHEHLFCLRINPAIDGYCNNSVVQVDATPLNIPVGVEGNKYGNAFYAKKKVYKTVGEAQAGYDSAGSRTWDMINEGKKHPYSGNPVSYKLVSRECPKLLPQEGGLVWKRAGFARNCVSVTKYEDHQFYPAGRHVPQTTGEPNSTNSTLPDWIEATALTPLMNTDVVLWHTFGVVHFPAPEDFPVMPAEGFSLLLRPRNFFRRNPALDVPPSYVRTPKDVLEGREGKKYGEGDSRLVVGGQGGCCKSGKRVVNGLK